MHNCLVLGGANTVFEDVRKALKLGEFHGVVTCNDVTYAWAGEIEAAVSLHGEKWPLWLKKRQLNGYPEPKQVVGHSNLKKSPVKAPDCITEYLDYLWPGQTEPGTSGLFAVKYVLDRLPQFDKMVLCGIPMTIENQHFFEDKPWHGAIGQRRGWNQTWHRTKGIVKSMSGWTAEQLGRPSIQWLAEGPEYNGEQ